MNVVGAVFIAQENGKHGKFYAIKMQKKDRIMKNRYSADRAASKVKARIKNTYFLNLKFLKINYPTLMLFQILQRAIGKTFLFQSEASFFDLENFYIVMELENGEDLHTFIHGSYYKSNEEMLKFFALNIMFGLNQLEEVSICKLYCNKKIIHLIYCRLVLSITTISQKTF